MLSRIEFLKSSIMAIGGIALKKLYKINNADESILKINGHVINPLGFPMINMTAQFIEQFSFNSSFGFLEQTFIPQNLLPARTDNKGFFSTSFYGYENKILGIHIGNQEVICRKVVNANIPFAIIQLWSRSNKAAYQRVQPHYNSLFFVPDKSRYILKEYIRLQQSHLYESLQAHGPYLGNHTDPDTGDCIDVVHGWGDPFGHCNHWGEPYMLDINRDINLPWGGNKNVVPFTVAEGFVFNAKAQHSSDSDYDRLWRVQLDKNYWYLPNSQNANASEVTWLKGRKGSIEGEMCLYFLGKKTAGGFETPKTNIARTNELTSFIGKRVWMMGTWCHDRQHGGPNEIHPVYWVVTFAGGLRRFLIQELNRLNPASWHNPASMIELYMDKQPEEMLRTVQAQIAFAFRGDRTALASLYADSAVHLNQYGVNQASLEQGTNHPANSIDHNSHFAWALNQTSSVLQSEINRRIKNIADAISNYGSGFQIFPVLLFTYEMIELLRLASKYGIQQVTGFSEIRPQAVAETVLESDPLNLGDKLKEAFHAVIDMVTQAGGSNYREDLAIMCTGFLHRATQYGIIKESLDSTAQIQRFKSVNAEGLKLVTATYLKDIWDDLIPYSRTGSSNAYK